MVRRALARKNFCGMAATPLGYKPNPQLFHRFRHRLSTSNGSFSLSSAGRCLYNPRPQQAVCMPKKNQKSHPGSAQILFLVNFFVSIFAGKRVTENNPWHATTLEWETPCPTQCGQSRR